LVNTLFKARAGQREFRRGVEVHRICGLLARRQYGKTTIAAEIALKKMMKLPGHTVIFGSVKIDLGREIVRKEADTLQRSFMLLARQAAEMKTKLEAIEVRDDGERIATALNLDDWANIYEHSRLELRLYHDRTTYSRTKVVALTPDIVGETGDLIMDEVGRAKRFREVLEAALPIISSNREFRALYTTTPPPDDSHPSFELLAPPIDARLPVNPGGNWYRSELGVWVLRISAFDAYADGLPLYDDDTGAEITPEESRRRASDRDAWDRNYGAVFVLGGSAAVGLLQLDTAQRRGIGKCGCFVTEEDGDMSRALEFLKSKLGKGPVGIGVDWATTEKEISNPTAVTVMEREGVEKIAVATFVWKTRNPDIALERLRSIVNTINARKEGGRARRLCQDATGEKYFCAIVSKQLAGLVPVEDVVASKTIEEPGQEPMTMKAKLGNAFIAGIDDNHITLAPDRYIKDDFRLVKRDRGSFTTETSASGQHGDTFDSHKLANHALDGSRSGAVTPEILARIRTGPNRNDPFTRFTPRGFTRR
jgi:hypothetical protein